MISDAEQVVRPIRQRGRWETPGRRASQPGTRGGADVAAPSDDATKPRAVGPTRGFGQGRTSAFQVRVSGRPPMASSMMRANEKSFENRYPNWIQPSFW